MEFKLMLAEHLLSEENVSFPENEKGCISAACQTETEGFEPSCPGKRTKRFRVVLVMATSIRLHPQRKIISFSDFYVNP